MKKILFVICAFMLTGMTMAQQAITPKEIDSEAKLRNIANDINNGVDHTYHYILTTDITLTEPWTPLGTPNSDNDNGSFNGIFDGQGNTIYNLNFNITEQDAIYMGLFGRIGSKGVVKDLNVVKLGNSDGIYASAGDTEGTRNIGTIAGVNHGTILNCTSNVDVYCYTSLIDGGGIAGENRSLIKNCIYYGIIHSNANHYDNQKVGGIVGDNETGGILQNCYSQATIQNTSGHELYGQNSEGGEVQDCAYHYGDAYSGGVRLEGRTFYKDQNWNTLCLPFDVNINRSVFSDAIVMELDIEDNYAPRHSTGIDVDATTGENTLYLNFKPVTGTIMNGKPYIFRWDTLDPDNLDNPSFPDATLTDLIDGSEPTGVTSLDGNVTFVGTFFSKDIEDAEGDRSIIYLGSGNDVYYPSVPMSINSFRAYFQLNNGYKVAEGESTVNVFNLDFGDGTTGLKKVEVSLSSHSGDIYDLSGRRVDGDALQPGIYIRDGKKFLIRK